MKPLALKSNRDNSIVNQLYKRYPTIKVAKRENKKNNNHFELQIDHT